MKRFLIAAGFVVGFPNDILAEEPEEEPTWQLYAAVSVTSDYRFNGVSLSDRKPAAQASLHAAHLNGWFAGVWLSTVDFKDPGQTSAELVVYAGRRWRSDDRGFWIQGTYSAYDEQVPGPTYDFAQFSAGATQSIGRTTFGMNTAWSPEGSYGAGQTLQIRGEAAYTLKPWLTASAHIGRGLIENATDRTYWDAGIRVKPGKLSFDVRWVDTNLDEPQCGYTNRCTGGIVGTITLATY
ncbi:MAG: TorF family putative porin [Pseudomonadales bacterium]